MEIVSVNELLSFDFIIEDCETTIVLLRAHVGEHFRAVARALAIWASKNHIHRVVDFEFNHFRLSRWTLTATRHTRKTLGKLPLPVKSHNTLKLFNRPFSKTACKIDRDFGELSVAVHETKNLLARTNLVPRPVYHHCIHY